MELPENKNSKGMKGNLTCNLIFINRDTFLRILHSSWYHTITRVKLLMHCSQLLRQLFVQNQIKYIQVGPEKIKVFLPSLLCIFQGYIVRIPAWQRRKSQYTAIKIEYRSRGNIDLYHGQDNSYKAWLVTKTKHSTGKSKPKLVSGPIVRLIHQSISKRHFNLKIAIISFVWQMN